MSTIEAIECVPFRIPLRRAVEFATGALGAAEHVLVRVRDSDGAVGTAEAIPRPMIHGETMGSVLAAVESEIAPAVVGTDLWASAQRHRRLASLIGNHTAKAAVELALHDLLGQVLGVSCWRLLGAYAPKVRLSAILGHGEPAAVADEALAHSSEHGITAFKLKTGVDVGRDIATCARVREAVGPDAFLWVDANHGYDLLDALAFDRGVRDLGLAWTEEPTPADRPLERARVVGEGALTVLADESCPTPGDVAREVLAGRCGAVSLKVGRSGYLDADRIRGLCESLGVAILAGSQGESSVGTLSCLAYAGAHESTVHHPSELSYFLKLDGSLLAEDLAVVDGHLEVPDRPGAGIVVSDEQLARFRIDR